MFSPFHGCLMRILNSSAGILQLKNGPSKSAVKSGNAWTFDYLCTLWDIVSSNSFNPSSFEHNGRRVSRDQAMGDFVTTAATKREDDDQILEAGSFAFGYIILLAQSRRFRNTLGISVLIEKRCYIDCKELALATART
ncbi:unnamed protein product, partial [Mesorhabditis belari]|uniref:Uncharacterized protein n=1 Tax=Mesorhabditis belari TaxID=2138241 RepID=A0AAF3EVF3_9BILA